jgi:hypothetical protein
VQRRCGCRRTASERAADPPPLLSSTCVSLSSGSIAIHSKVLMRISQGIDIDSVLRVQSYVVKSGCIVSNIPPRLGFVAAGTLSFVRERLDSESEAPAVTLTSTSAKPKLACANRGDRRPAEACVARRRCIARITRTPRPPPPISAPRGALFEPAPAAAQQEGLEDQSGMQTIPAKSAIRD